MGNGTESHRVFLLLQGPHGPFFDQLGGMLRRTGAEVWRVGFNAGDQAFWRDRDRFIAHRGPAKDWPATFQALCADKGVTDIVLYGDVRPLHASAIRLARPLGLRVHVFEEGYLRPYWVTYERNGSNGHSRLMQMSVESIRAALSRSDGDVAPPPAHWGDMRQHIFYGALYHFHLLCRNRAYPNYRPHRNVSVGAEFRYHLKRLAMMPAIATERRFATRRIRRGGYPYHLALLQLEHDASFRAHSPFASMAEFLSEVIVGFARGAPSHHQLVIKEHPLDDGRVPLRSIAHKMARAKGIANRVHFLRGGKLATLLDEANSAVTVNSTSGQQVLWRGKPLKAFGATVYGKPEFVSSQPLEEFFSDPRRPSLSAYMDYRRFLLQTSQVPGGYYSRSGRQQLLRHVVDMMLDDADPYDALFRGSAAPRQQLYAVI